MTEQQPYFIIDVFAGPGGLGEGFSSLRQDGKCAFKTALSIEKDQAAYNTLKLRHFFRSFWPNEVPEAYYQYARGEITIENLYAMYPVQAEAASKTALLCTLGEENHSFVKQKIGQSLGVTKKWVLVGGPPCQAYSLVGRSRMSSNPDFKDDPRHFLYKEYLRILADHKPPIFVMENVKGLLSSKVEENYVIHQIMHDLTHPSQAIFGTDAGLEYRLYSLSEAGLKHIDPDPRSFIVRAEEYGIPQARHRIFIVGVRADIDLHPQVLKKEPMVSVQDVIGNMPKLRSAISKAADSDELWLAHLQSLTEQKWFTELRDQGNTSFLELAQNILNLQRGERLPKKETSYTPPSKLKSWFYDGRLSTLMSHEARAHMPSDLHRYFFASLYASIWDASPKLQDFPEQLLPNHKNVQEGIELKKFADRFRVQLPHNPSTTITSHISKDGHYFIHYDPVQSRSLTVREAARLQTFPDNYKFEGNRTEQYHQIGNAVPPLLAYKISEIIRELLSEWHC